MLVFFNIHRKSFVQTVKTESYPPLWLSPNKLQDDTQASFL